MVNFYILFKQRFAVNAISLLDSICLTYNNIILLIYFIYHLFKIHEIKTKIEFVMYLIIHLIVAVSLISYYHSLPHAPTSHDVLAPIQNDKYGSLHNNYYQEYIYTLLDRKYNITHH